MRGIDMKAGSQLENARSRLIRSPMWKMTTSGVRIPHSTTWATLAMTYQKAWIRRPYFMSTAVSMRATVAPGRETNTMCEAPSTTWVFAQERWAMNSCAAGGLAQGGAGGRALCDRVEGGFLRRHVGREMGVEDLRVDVEVDLSVGQRHRFQGLAHGAARELPDQRLRASPRPVRTPPGRPVLSRSDFPRRQWR
ncbi:hypothetical protein STRCI_006063 [Streptomyces cinnabarinus]|uniref:Uncharacterized protein n=1 Tax=Streptomyces cinnabarinus TaxID=67287 RepID=A0ABY7KS04_9ACTN|nr:hypothetical protein [Streptomyces cinnabarinus]WAZ27359.1 hypothetical protein STRCI_006063 [Streptomyces cinnabarinus]